LDRAIILYLPAIPDTKRRPEAEFWHEFEAARPGILGALLDAVSTAPNRLPTVNLETLPRMADFAVWATAAEPALGCKEGTFIRAYTGNRQAANALSLEASPVAPFLQRVAKAGFTGTASDLLPLLNEQANEALKHQQSWPKNGRALSNSLRRIAPNLRATGVEVAFGGRDGGTGRRLITIKDIPIAEQRGDCASPSSPPSQTPEKQSFRRDTSSDATTTFDGNPSPCGPRVAQNELAENPHQSPIVTHRDGGDAKTRTHSRDTAPEEVIDL
jgi:hypothetical protein